MYENAYKNIKETSLKDLENFLQLLADLEQEIELFALGGTAMIIKGIKEATKDIDFLTTLDYEAFRNCMNATGLKETSRSTKICSTWYANNDLRIDVFFDESIMGITLPEDWRGISEEIRTIGKVKLHILNWYDIIITKTARSEPRDIEDILMIIKDQHIDFQKLKKRYYDLAETSLIAAYDLKFKVLERRWEKK